MYSIIKENYQYYLLFLPALFGSAIILPVSSLAVLAGGLGLFLFRERTELIIVTFVVIIVMGDNLWDMFEVFKTSRIVAILFAVGISGLIMLNIEKGIDRRISYFIPFWLVVLVSSLWFSSSYAASITRVFSYLFLVISVFTLFRYVYEHKQQILTEHLFVITALILAVSVLGIFSPLGDLFYFSNRFMGIFGNPNTMALFLIMMYPIIDNLDYEDTRISPIGKYLLLAFIFVVMFFTGSRNGMLSLLIYIVGKIFISQGFSGKLVSVAAVSMALLLMLNFETISSKVPFLQDYARVESLENSTASGRTLAWAVALDKIEDDPWLGNGMSYTDDYFQAFKDQHQLVGRFWNSVWNSYLAIMLEGGIIGLLAYLVFLFGLVKHAANNKLVYFFIVAAMFSAMFESWMVSSLNVCTTLFLFNFIILSKRA